MAELILLLPSSQLIQEQLFHLFDKTCGIGLQKMVVFSWCSGRGRHWWRVNGSPLQTHGQGLLQFTLQDKTFEASVIVTSDLKVEVILGVGFFAEIQLRRLIRGCKTLCIPSKHISLQFLGSTAQPVRDVGLVTVEKLLVPPKSQTEIMVSVTQSAEGGTWMVEGCGRSGVMVAHAIVRPLKGAVAYLIQVKKQ